MICTGALCLRTPHDGGVELIPATELTAIDPKRGRRVHLLCYWPDDCAALEKHCRTMGTRRMECCTQSAQELEAIYPQFRQGDGPGLCEGQRGAV